MAKKQLVQFEGRMATVMGLRGLVQDGQWIIDADPFGSGSYILAEVDAPNPPISQKLEKLIEDDRAAGNEDKIDHLLISNRYAVILYMEGRVTREMLEQATQKGKDLVFNLHLAGATRKIIVRNERDLKYTCATMDADGNVV